MNTRTELQKRITEIQSTRGTTGFRASAERAALQRSIEKEFMAHFNLKHSKTFISFLCLDGFDHVSVYRQKVPPHLLVVVTQPYDRQEKLKAWAKSQNIECAELPEWAWYYPGPGHADFFMLTVPKAKQRPLKQ